MTAPTIQEARYVRHQHMIFDNETGTIYHCFSKHTKEASINAAKRKSRELQDAGATLRVAHSTKYKPKSQVKYTDEQVSL